VSVATVSAIGDWQADNPRAEEALFIEVLNQNGHSLSNQPGTGSIHFVQLTFEDAFEFDILYSTQSATVAMTCKSPHRSPNSIELGLTLSSGRPDQRRREQSAGFQIAICQSLCPQSALQH
jgi:hypothetical protein